MNLHPRFWVTAIVKLNQRQIITVSSTGRALGLQPRGKQFKSATVKVFKFV
jgi:hypothetical protein